MLYIYIISTNNNEEPDFKWFHFIEAIRTPVLFKKEVDITIGISIPVYSYIKESPHFLQRDTSILRHCTPDIAF